MLVNDSLPDFIGKYLNRYLAYTGQIDRKRNDINRLNQRDVPQNGILPSQKLREKNAELKKLYNTAWRDFHILGGHYVLLNKSGSNLEIELFINPDLEEHDHQNKNYSEQARKFDHIDYDIDQSKAIVLDVLFESNQRLKFNHKRPYDIPKYYQHLSPLQSKLSIHQRSYADKLNKAAKPEYAFSLSDEIIFFNYAWRWLFRLMQVFPAGTLLSNIHEAVAKISQNPWHEKHFQEVTPEWRIIQAVNSISPANQSFFWNELAKTDNVNEDVYDLKALNAFFIETDWQLLGLKCRPNATTGDTGFNCWQLLRYATFVSQEHTPERKTYADFTNWELLYPTPGNNAVKAAIPIPIDFQPPTQPAEKLKLHLWITDIIQSFLSFAYNPNDDKLWGAKQPKELTIDTALRLLHVMSRTNIIPNFYFTAFHERQLVPDQFIFPLVNSNVEAGEFSDPGNIYSDTGKIIINKPLLIYTYLRPLYFIVDKEYYDESDLSLKGFKVTEQMCRYIANDVINDVYYGSIVKARTHLETLKTAKSAIMGRNMSHNIGSHVLSYLQTKLHNVNDILKNDVLANLIKQSSSGYKLYAQEQEIAIQNIESIEIPFLVGLGKFISYLQERQDFIATISTDLIPELSSVNFKDFVLDFFAWDSKAMRHPSTVAGSSYTVNILLSYIALSEGISRGKGDKNAKAQLKIFVNNKLLDDSYEQDDPIRRLEVGLPSGIMGRQAIYSIFENFIRNSAKHGRSASDEKDFELNIVIGNPSSADFKNTGFDHPFTSQLLTDDIYQTYNRDYMRVIISDRYSNYEQAKDKIKEKIRLPYIDPGTSRLDEKAKGLKEMRISAAWLRQADISEEQDQVLPLISFGYVEVDKIKHVAYQFFLKKTLNALIIVPDSEFEKMGPDLKKIELSGWEFIPSSKVRADRADKDDQLYKLSYQLVAIDRSINSLFFDSVLLPVRKCFYNLADLDYADYKTLIDAIATDNKASEKLYWKLYSLHIAGFLGHTINEEVVKAGETETKLSGPVIGIHDVKHTSYSSPGKNIPVLYNDYEFEKTDNINALVKAHTAIVFWDHLDRQADRQKFIDDYFLKTDSIWPVLKEKYQGVNYIETITGGNSSARVLRYEPKSELWYLRLVESAMTNVLIIDERIWDSFNLDDTLSKEYIKTQITEVVTNANDVMSLFKSEIINNLNDKEPDGFYDKVSTLFQKKEELIAYLYNLLEDFNYQVFFQALRKIYFGNINGEKLVLSDASTILFNPKEISFTGTSSHKDLQNIHFVSIHLGLIDKLANLISSPIEETEVKGRIINALQSTFGAKPVVLVHSGRSRPDSATLPIDVPFISYSIIRSLLDDTKLSLTDRFYSSLTSTI